MKDKILYICLGLILLVWAISGFIDNLELKREAKELKQEILIKETEIQEYEKEIKTLHEIAEHSKVTYDSASLKMFDSSRAEFKRHLRLLRQPKG